MKLTFLLPGDSASGGTRVTMQMGNRLLEHGHDVRIAYRTPRLFSLERLLSSARSVKFRFQGLSETRWLSDFKGKKEAFIRLDDLQFENEEIVIATGPHTIPELSSLKRRVLKVRYCHGFFVQDLTQKGMMWMWREAMDTIAVSPVLVPALKRHCGGRILGVVPNGICPQEYFIENRARDGIGFIFSTH